MRQARRHIAEDQLQQDLQSRAKGIAHLQEAWGGTCSPAAEGDTGADRQIERAMAALRCNSWELGSFLTGIESPIGVQLPCPWCPGESISAVHLEECPAMEDGDFSGNDGGQRALERARTRMQDPQLYGGTEECDEVGAGEH